MFKRLSTITIVICAIAVITISQSVYAQPEGLVLWNKLGSDEEVLNSAFGPNLEFYIGGVWPEVQGDRQYVPGMFGNCVTLEGSYGVCDRIHNLVLSNLSNFISPEQGCIELWYYQTETPVSYSHGVYRLFDGPYGLGAGIAFHVEPDYICFGITGPVYIIYDVGDIPNNEWVHLAASWDRSGIDGASETMRLYVDGESVIATTENGWTSTLGARADICGGNDQNIIDKFYMDNLKIWNYAKTDFSDRFTESPIVSVVIDIKPGSCPNPLNVKSKGVLPVAIVGTEDFDVTTVDPETVELEGVAAHKWEIRDATNPPADDEPCFEAIDEDGDGIPDNIDEYDDLVLYFYTQAVVEALGDVEDGEELTLTLTGNLTSGTPIEGEDSVIIGAKGMLAPSKHNTLSTLWGEIKTE